METARQLKHMIAGWIIWVLVTPVAALGADGQDNTNHTLPVFEHAAEADPVDPEFRSDVAILAPAYGEPANVMIFGAKGSEPGKPAMKLISPIKADKSQLYKVRAIVEMPVLCGLMDEFMCGERLQPNGVLQITRFNGRDRFEALVRFPSVPGISVRVQNVDKRVRKLRLWIIRNKDTLVKRIDVEDKGLSESRTMPILHGVSTAGLPETDIKRLKRFVRATPVDVFDKNGGLLARLLVRPNGGVGYAKLSAAFCNRFSALQICSGRTRLTYAEVTIDHQHEVVANNVRLSITLRKPGASEEVTIVAYKHGLEPTASFNVPELTGFLYVQDLAMAETPDSKNAEFDIRVVFSDSVDDLADKETILGHIVE